MQGYAPSLMHTLSACMMHACRHAQKIATTAGFRHLGSLPLPPTPPGQPTRHLLGSLRRESENGPGNENGVGDLRIKFMRTPCLGAAADRLHAHPHTPCTQKRSWQTPKLAALPDPGGSLCTATEPASPENEPRAAVFMPPSSTPAAGDPAAHQASWSAATRRFTDTSHPHPALPSRIRQRHRRAQAHPTHRPRQHARVGPGPPSAGGCLAGASTQCPIRDPMRVSHASIYQVPITGRRRAPHELTAAR